MFQREHNIGWLALYDPENKLNYVRETLKITENNFFSKRFIEFRVVSDLLINHVPRVLECFSTFIEINVGIATSYFRRCPGVQIVQPRGGWMMLILLDMKSFLQFENDVDLCQCLFEEENLKLAPGYTNGWPNALKLPLVIEQHLFVEMCRRLNVFCRKYAA